MNLLQGIITTMQQPSIPLHTGESFFVWRQYVATSEGRILCQTLLNHTADPEPQGFIKGFVAETEEPQIKELATLMKREGIEFPSQIPEKVDTSGEAIPAGAHFSDQEVCHLLVGKVEMLMLYCYFSMAQTLRYDLGIMFARFMADLGRQGITLKQLADKRGWLLHPPAFSPNAPH